MSSELDILFDNFEEEHFSIFYILSDGNIGAFTILLSLHNEIETSKLIRFLQTLWNKKIIGDRLWYIYKNECDESIYKLVIKDLRPFNEKYFNEKIDK